MSEQPKRVVGRKVVEGGTHEGDRYTWQAWFTEDAHYPWRWIVRMNGAPLGDVRHTGFATTKGQARRRALRYIKRHKKHAFAKTKEYRA